MRTLAVVEFLTLDGVMQGLGSPDEDRDGGFQHGGWSAPYSDDVLGSKALEGIGRTTAYLFGRRTYEHMAAHWPQQPAEDPIAAHLNATPKYVVSRTLTSVDWDGARILSGDVTESVQGLKAAGEGVITVLGSGVLVQTLVERGLIDEYRLLVHPLVLGTGKRLFRQAPRPIALALVDCTPTPKGVLLLSYRPV